MSVRAKFRVQEIKQTADYKGSQITLYAVSTDDTPENQRFHKYTPSGTVTIFVDNPPAEEFFQLGKYVYLNFEDAEK